MDNFNFYSPTEFVFGKGRIRLGAFVAAFGTFLCVIELFAPVIAGFLRPAGDFIQVSLTEAAPLAAFLVYMPFASHRMLAGHMEIQDGQ